jgi:hypothetical protein
MEKFEDIGCTKLRKDDRSLAVAGGRWQVADGRCRSRGYSRRAVACILFGIYLGGRL